MHQGTVLVVDDNREVLVAAELLLRDITSRIHTLTDPSCIPEIMSTNSVDVILLDMNFTRDVSSGKEGLYWLGKILELDPDAVVILITAYGDIELAVQGIRAGATDFILKPWQNEKLWATVASGIKLRLERRNSLRYRNRADRLHETSERSYPEFLGRSPAVNKVRAIIRRVAATDTNVLICGESGTGKELVAREVHRHSNRSHQPFVKIDVGALSDSLFESELFGHEKGAFTGATAARMGMVETANQGTLFLDEIGNLSLPLQAKLLRVVEHREVTPLGSNVCRPVDIRILSATNRSLEQMVSQGEFRKDLLYRLNAVEITVPPLRSRGREDIILLASFYLARLGVKHGREGLALSPSAEAALVSYDWPGNVRELKHVLERAVILSDSEVLTPDKFNFAGNVADALADDSSLSKIEAQEKSLIRRSLAHHAGVVSRVAEDLGLSRAALYRRMKKYGL